MSRFSFFTPPVRLSGFTGAGDTLKGMVRSVQGDRGERSLVVRSLTEKAIGQVFPKDYQGEIMAIGYFVHSFVYYLNDPLHVELLKDPTRLAEEIIQKGYARGDCDDIACLTATMALQVGRVSQFVVAGFGEPMNFSHVFCRVKEPKSGKWLVCDPVAGADVSGMLSRITTYQIWSCDEPPERGPIKVVRKVM
jgi:hypothetical protein